MLMVAPVPFIRPIADPKPRSKSSAGIQSLVQAEKLMQIAILLPSAAFIGWLAGAWLDSRLHQTWIGPAGIVFGGIAGIVHVVRMVIVSGGGSVSGKPNGYDGERENKDDDKHD